MRDVLWTLILKRTSLNNISFTLKEANDFVKNIISGQNGVFVIFNKRRNRIGKPMMRCNFENTQSKYNKEWFILLRLIFLILPTTNGLPMRFLTLCILTNKLIWPFMNLHYVTLRIVQHFYILPWAISCCIKPLFFQLLIIWICLSFNRSICVAFY